jgi:hypothetical protein
VKKKSRWLRRSEVLFTSTRRRVSIDASKIDNSNYGD